VAQLAFFHENNLFVQQNVPETQNIPLVHKKQKKGGSGGGVIHNTSSMIAGLTNAERFAKAVRDGPRGRKNNKKNKKSNGRATKPTHEVDEDPICSDSAGSDAQLVNGQGPVIPVLSLEVVLFEAESRKNNDDEIRLYRIEAERLFAIGMNMGVTTNAERISLVERLIDLEDKEVNVVDEWEDEIVNQ
jgi:hypothetical protein